MSEVTDPGTPREPYDPEEEQIPEQFRGKSKAEIAQSYAELQKMQSRQANELGEIRKLLQQQQQPKDPEEDFFDDPQKAVRHLIQNEVLPLRQQSLEARLNAEHPDWMEVVEDPGFADWLQGSRFRQQLYTAARTQMDYEAADELLTTWKTVNGNAEAETEKAVKQDRKRRAAASEGGSARQPRGKIYSRSWLRELKKEDPKRYAALDRSGELAAAYREGRTEP